MLLSETIANQAVFNLAPCGFSCRHRLKINLIFGRRGGKVHRLDGPAWPAGWLLVYPIALAAALAANRTPCGVPGALDSNRRAGPVLGFPR